MHWEYSARTDGTKKINLGLMMLQVTKHPIHPTLPVLIPFEENLDSNDWTSTLVDLSHGQKEHLIDSAITVEGTGSTDLRL